MVIAGSGLLVSCFRGLTVRRRQGVLALVVIWKREAGGGRRRRRRRRRTGGCGAYWRLNFYFERGRRVEEVGMSERGRTPVQRLLLCEQNAYSVSAATGLFIQRPCAV